MYTFDYDGAMEAAKSGHIHEWVLEFLEGPGANKNLARVLRQKGEFYLGPVDYPIDELKPILGPDTSFPFQEDPEKTNAAVEAMMKSFQTGWQPMPLIATNLWESYFTVADGGHRYELFKRLGIKTYPTIFYFRDEASKKAFLSKSL